eukprot:32806_1
MVSASRLATTISIIYFSIYIFVFFIASIYCAYEVEKRHHLIIKQSSKKQNKSDIDSEKPNEIECMVMSTNDKTDKDDNIDAKDNTDNKHMDAANDKVNEDYNDEKTDEQKDEKIGRANNLEDKSISCSKRLLKFIKYWGKSLWTKKKIYISIVPHLFDQATDLGVIYTYYTIWNYPDQYKQENERIQMKAIFYSSIAVIIMHKTISCGAIYALTKNMFDVFLQFIDFMMIKAIYLNYKLDTKEPGNAQRYLQILEGTFESGPQILISILFITKTYDPNTGIDPIILISTVSSIWTLTARVTSDDKLVLKDEWKHMLLSGHKCPYINYVNWRYLVRVVCWRFFEISSRVFILVLLWIAVGGFALIIIMCLELIGVFILCFFGEGVIVLGNMMYYTMTAVGNIPGEILDAAATYKLCSSFIFLILITIFCTVPFEAWKVENYDVRHDVVVEPIKLFMLIYSWIASAISVCCIGYIIKNGKSDQSSVRDCTSLLLSGEFTDLINLIEFGSPFSEIYPTVGTGYNEIKNVLLFIAAQTDTSPGKAYLFQKLYESDLIQSQVMIKEVEKGSDRNCLDYAVRYNVYLTRYLIENAKMKVKSGLLDVAVEFMQLDVIKYLITIADIHMNSISETERAFKSAVRNERYDIMDYLVVNPQNVQYANCCLTLAVIFDKINVVKYLVSNTNVDVNKTDYNNQTYLFKVVNDTEMFKYFVENGVDVNITDIYDQSCLFKLIRSDNKENKELLQYLIEGKNANWVIVNDTNESLPALADKIKKKEIVNYFRTLHDRKKGEFTFKELLDLWGLKKYVLRFQEEKYADIQRWNELIDDEKKLTALVEVSNALYSEEINERRTKLNVELFKNNYQKWLQVKDNKKQFFDAFFL